MKTCKEVKSYRLVEGGYYSHQCIFHFILYFTTMLQWFCRSPENKTVKQLKKKKKDHTFISHQTLPTWQIKHMPMPSSLIHVIEYLQFLSSHCSPISIKPIYCFKWKFPGLPNLESAYSWNVLLFRKTKSTMPHTSTGSSCGHHGDYGNVGKMAHHPCHQNVKTIFNAEDVGNKCRER
jgi:hypothetical protein